MTLNHLFTYAVIRITSTVAAGATAYVLSMLDLFQGNALLAAQASLGITGLAIALVIGVLTVLLTKAGSDKRAFAQAASAPEEEAETFSSEPSFEQKCAGVAEKFGLSPREAEIFVMLARGYSSPRIQNELYIAAGTVSYHSHNIYSKLGVHSKQELIDVVEAVSAASSE